MSYYKINGNDILSTSAFTHTFSGIFFINNATVSTSATSGALKITGGDLTIDGDLEVGESIKGRDYRTGEIIGFRSWNIANSNLTNLSTTTANSGDPDFLNTTAISLSTAKVYYTTTYTNSVSGSGIIVYFEYSFWIQGSDDDTFTNVISITNGTTTQSMTYTSQWITQGGDGGGGMRSSALFPVTYYFEPNASNSTFTITLTMSRTVGDDNVYFLDESGTLIITEYSA